METLRKVVRFKLNKENPLTGNRNYILSADDFYLSYQPDSNPSGISMFRSDTDMGETAIFDRKANKFYILNGDFRKDYEKLFHKGLKACVSFYKKNKKYRSSWSTD